jgi:hypothetical protein
MKINGYIKGKYKMKTFKEMLSEAKDNKIVTVADLKRAIEAFDDLPQGKKSSEAKKIAKFAEKLGYTLKKKSILDLLDSKKETTIIDKKIKVDKDTLNSIVLFAKRINYDLDNGSIDELAKLWYEDLQKLYKAIDDNRDEFIKTLKNNL